MTTKTHRLTDPRTTQLVEVFTALLVTTAVHTLCYLAVGRYTFSASYDLCVVLAGFFVTVIAATVLRRTRGWHAGQIALFVCGSLVLSLVHLIVHPALIGDFIWRSLDHRSF